MKKLENTSVSAETHHSCEHCGRTFIRESTIYTHLCEGKRRWMDREKQSNRIGFSAWLEFHQRSGTNKKARSYADFIRSAYYLAFVKWGNYCITINALQPLRWCEWLVRNKIRIDEWCSDTIYSRWLIEYLRSEDPYDAIARSISTLEEHRGQYSQYKDLLRYSSLNALAYQITTGRISPWLLYCCDSGQEFLSRLDATQLAMVYEYIHPEQWALLLRRNPEAVSGIKEILKTGGF